MTALGLLCLILAAVSFHSLNCLASKSNVESYIQYKIITERSCYQEGRRRCTGWWAGKRCWTEYRCQYRQITKAIPEIKYRCRFGWTPYPSCSTPICSVACKPGHNCTSPNVCTDIDECKQNQHQCQHICLNSVGSYKCQCIEGYQLKSDNKTCEDRNECATNSHECQQNCHNTHGSYICSCNPGYTLAVNGKSCNANN